MSDSFINSIMPSAKERLQSEPVGQRGGMNVSATRRRILATSGVAIGGALAGCMDLRGSENTPDEYETLQQRPIYVAAGVDLSVPDQVQIVDAPGDADLIVMPDTPDVEAARIVTWLEQTRAIALLGEESQSTWLSWVQSDAYVEAFDPEGIAEGDPEPDLLIAWDAGSEVSTAHYHWWTGPTDNDVLHALNETLEDIKP